MSELQVNQIVIEGILLKDTLNTHATCKNVTCLLHLTLNITKMAEQQVEYSFLGKSGLKVSNIALGTMTFGKDDKSQYCIIYIIFTLYIYQRTLEEPGKRGQETYNYLSLLSALSACFARSRMRIPG